MSIVNNIQTNQPSLFRKKWKTFITIILKLQSSNIVLHKYKQYKSKLFTIRQLIITNTIRNNKTNLSWTPWQIQIEKSPENSTIHLLKHKNQQDSFLETIRINKYNEEIKIVSYEKSNNERNTVKKQKLDKRTSAKQ